MDILKLLDLSSFSKFSEDFKDGAYIFRKSFSFIYIPDIAPDTATVFRFNAFSTGRTVFRYFLKSGDDVIYDSMDYC
ncbi:MAG: hypothetical protein IJM97_04875, partial [Clostridia bacterium]|nr:hypothetical protein [Clostridia bacterium]